MKTIFKKWWFWVIVVVLILFTIGSNSEDTPDTTETTEKTKETTTDVTTPVVTTAKKEVVTNPPEETPKKEFNSTVYEGLYAQVYVTQPHWLDASNSLGLEEGWYVSFTCYNTCNKSLDFIIDNKASTKNPDVWETLPSAANTTYRMLISTDKETKPTELTIQCWISQTAIVDYNLSLIVDKDNFLIEFVE